MTDRRVWIGGFRVFAGVVAILLLLPGSGGGGG